MRGDSVCGTPACHTLYCLIPAVAPAHLACSWLAYTNQYDQSHLLSVPVEPVIEPLWPSRTSHTFSLSLYNQSFTLSVPVELIHQPVHLGHFPQYNQSDACFPSIQPSQLFSAMWMSQWCFSDSFPVIDPSVTVPVNLVLVRSSPGSRSADSDRFSYRFASSHQQESGQTHLLKV